MKLQSFSVSIAARRHAVRWRLVLLVAASALVVSSLSAAQTDAPGEPVTIPGAEISGWGQVSEVPARFGVPAGSTSKVPAVLILHGSGGVDGRGAFYAKALQEAGIAALEITMFPRGGRPRAGTQATMPHAAAAREHATVRYVEGATHGFDGQKPMEFKDEFARGRGGRVSVIPSPKDAAEARQAVVSFFVKHLKP